MSQNIQHVMAFSMKLHQPFSWWILTFLRLSDLEQVPNHFHIQVRPNMGVSQINKPKLHSHLTDNATRLGGILFWGWVVQKLDGIETETVFCKARNINEYGHTHTHRILQSLNPQWIRNHSSLDMIKGDNFKPYAIYGQSCADMNWSVHVVKAEHLLSC